MRADQRRVATGGRPLERSPPVTQAQEQVFLAVGEAANVNTSADVAKPSPNRGVLTWVRTAAGWSSRWIVIWSPMFQS